MGRKQYRERFPSDFDMFSHLFASWYNDSKLFMYHLQLSHSICHFIKLIFLYHLYHLWFSISVSTQFLLVLLPFRFLTYFSTSDGLFATLRSAWQNQKSKPDLCSLQRVGNSPESTKSHLKCANTAAFHRLVCVYYMLSYNIYIYISNISISFHIRKSYLRYLCILIKTRFLLLWGPKRDRFGGASHARLGRRVDEACHLPTFWRRNSQRFLKVVFLNLKCFHFGP